MKITGYSLHLIVWCVVLKYRVRCNWITRTEHYSGCIQLFWCT